MRSAIEDVKTNGKKSKQVAVAAAAGRPGRKPTMIGDLTLTEARKARKAALVEARRASREALKLEKDADKRASAAQRTLDRASAALDKLQTKPLKNKVEHKAAVEAARSTIKDAKSVLSEAIAAVKAASKAVDAAAKIEEKAEAFLAKLDN